MADFRKMFFVFAALVMILAIPASAQLTCTAFVANQPTLRQEGVTEPAGDTIISCTVGATVPTGALAGSQTLSLYVSGTTITSRQLYSGTSAPSSIPTEASLLVNDCVNSLTPNGGACATAPTQGFLQNGALVFSNFVLPLAANSTFTLRVTNVRVNANSVASGTFITGTILATFPIQNQSGLVLGVAQSSLSVSTPSTLVNFTQCTSQSSGSALSISPVMTIKELVQTAFKSPNACPSTGGNPGTCPNNSLLQNTIAGAWYQNGLNTESQTVVNNPVGYTNAISAVPGQADSSTRIRVNFSNIPAGVTISVPVTICQSSTTANCSSAPSNASLAQASSGGDTATFSLASGTISITSSGSVTYQVVTQSGGSIDSFLVPVTVTYTYTPPSTPAVGTVLISATYAPTSAEVTTLNPTFGIPRFADTSVLTPVFSIAACQTDLLFTFLTNQAGFDTGFEIANTSSDPFGTAAQNGTCTLNWYGSGPAAGTATTTPSIAAGTAYANLVSTAAAGFQGYMIAVCNFQFGHGFAFISDGYGQPGRGLSQGYLASVIPTPGLQNGAPTSGARNASDASLTSKAGTGEALNQ